MPHLIAQAYDHYAGVARHQAKSWPHPKPVWSILGMIRYIKRGRLGPAGRLVVRFATGELVLTDAFRAERRRSADFRAIVRTWAFTEPVSPLQPPLRDEDLYRFGWLKEEVKDVVEVLAQGREPAFSMGDDAALGFLERRIPVASYLRERFAQVTNPPIDPLRESFVFDMRAFVGAGQTNGDVPAPHTIIALPNGIISEGAFDVLCRDERLQVKTLSLALENLTLAARIDMLCFASRGRSTRWRFVIGIGRPRRCACGSRASCRRSNSSRTGA